MASVELVRVSNYVLENATAAFRDRRLHVIIGPNGAGKTTLLKAIAGLVGYSGSILFDGKPVDDLPPEKRGAGYMPQTTALFPHMTVEENIAFGLRARGAGRDDALREARRVMEELGIEDLWGRMPSSLSGGEAKKAALARAIAVRPRVLLLDEPFAGIHYDSRVELAHLIRMLSRETTVLLVTHEVEEALDIGCCFTVLSGGRILYTGDRRGFIGRAGDLLPYINSLDCRIASMGESGLRLSCGGLELFAPSETRAPPGSRATALIPAHRIYVAQKPMHPTLNTFEAIVETVKPISPSIARVVLSLDGGRIALKIRASPRLARGRRVYVKIPARSIRVEAWGGVAETFCQHQAKR